MESEAIVSDQSLIDKLEVEKKTWPPYKQLAFDRAIQIIRQHEANHIGEVNKMVSSEIGDNKDNIGYLVVATIANNLEQHTWEDEWLAFYKPSAWLGSHRAATAFLTEKLQGFKPVVESVKASEIPAHDEGATGIDEVMRWARSDRG